MPIDVARAMAYPLAPEDSSWTEDQVILYHLGLGAGNPSTAAEELAYTYEARLKVLPTFAVIPAARALLAVMTVPGLEFNPVMLLHGEQEIEIHRPLPTQATARTTARIANIYDKGKAALVILESTTVNDHGETLFVNRFSLFLRGEGGFGGQASPRPVIETPPDRAPDRVIESPTLPQQALIYRLSGDKNPLHCDPDFAALGGFERPILHGLCSYGVVCKAVVDHELGGDVTRVAKYGARFRGVVFPGETLVTSVWRENGRLVVQADVKERGTPAISHAYVELRG